MAAHRKAKSSRRAKTTKSKRRAKRAVAANKSVRKVAPRKKVAKKRAVSRRPKRTAKPAQRRAQVPAAETVIVDTIEQPAPGVVVVTETEYTVRQDNA